MNDLNDFYEKVKSDLAFLASEPDFILEAKQTGIYNVTQYEVKGRAKSVYFNLTRFKKDTDVYSLYFSLSEDVTGKKVGIDVVLVAIGIEDKSVYNISVGAPYETVGATYVTLMERFIAHHEKLLDAQLYTPSAMEKYRKLQYELMGVTPPNYDSFLIGIIAVLIIISIISWIQSWHTATYVMIALTIYLLYRIYQTKMARRE